MRRGILIIFIISIATKLCFGGNTGKISGRITDETNGSPLVGANVIITHRWSNDQEIPLDEPLGAATDSDGQYYIINVDPGEYSITISYIGYRPYRKTHVVVYVDKTVYLDVALTPQVLEGESVTVIAYRENVVQPDLTATKQVYNINEITSMAGISDISDILTMQADVVDDHFRGGRLGESQYILGGGAIVNPLNNSRAFKPMVTGLEQVEVYTSGFSAEYGNAQSGVINMVAKEGQNTWESRLEFSSTIPYYKSWLESKDDNGEYIYDGGSPYCVEALDFFSILADDDEWLKENPTQPGRALYDPGYGFGPRYLPLRVTWPPNPLSYKDSIQIARLGQIQWYQAIRKVGMEYDEKPDYRLDVSTGGPIAENLRMFIALRQDVTQPIILMTTPDINRQVMSSLVYLPNKKNKFKFTLTLDQSFENYFSSSWRDWLFDPTLSGSRRNYLNAQYGGLWTYVVSQSTFMDLKVSLLTTSFTEDMDLLREDEYTSEYRNRSNWTDYTAPSNHRVGIIYNYTRNEQTQTYQLNYSINSQVNRNNFVKTGIQFAYYNVNVDNLLNRYGEADVRSLDFNVNPYEGALYIQDKMEFEGLIANIGLRWDFYQLNTEYYSDIYSPLRNPNYDPSKPYLERGPYYSQELAAKTSTELYSHLQPRIGISFPISETMVFHLNYGTFSQRPNFNQLFYNEVTINNEILTLGNPRLKPEETNAYDIGIVQGFPRFGLSLDVSAYYKDVKNLVQTAYYYDEQQSVYSTYINRDYADIKGFHISLEKSQGNIRGFIRYNYESATGKSSNDLNAPVTYFEVPDPNYGFVELPDPEDVYLDYDRTHKLVFNLRYLTPRNFGFKIVNRYPLEGISVSATYSFYSGRPFTDPSQGRLYGVRTPNEQDLRLRAEKRIRWNNDLEMSLYVEGYNVLNEIKWHYSRTFNHDYNTPRWFTDRDEILTYKEYPPYYTSQEIYMLDNEPRHWRVGAIFKF
ncbi:MAG: TonB-dependent receptor [Candidatus Marinimicrobia bacterium]|nr:TonB-dependent receptor [Candidatus Neomarinimicrobiota bacterium]